MNPDQEALKFKNITDEIVHIIGKDRESLASAMVRFQEHYESPFPEIRGKIFTLGFLRSLGSRQNRGVYTYEGGKTYGADWSGYNFPSYVLEPFIKGLFDPLAPLEEDIVNALRCKLGKFYVIATYGEDDPSETLDHEVCHALYYLNEEYKSEVDEALSTVDLTNLKKVMVDWGYCEDVLLDECHAYLSADYDWLFKDKKDDMKKFNVKISKTIHNKLRKIKDKHFKEGENNGKK